MKVLSVFLLLSLLPYWLHAATPVVENSPEAEAAKREAVRREVEASEDPMTESEAASMEAPAEAAVKKYDYNFYGNYRLRLRSTDGGDFTLTDGGSRVGVDGHYQLFSKLKVFGRAELGFNLLDELDFVLDRKNSAPEGKEGNSFFERLLYIGFETPGNFLTVGKNWSTYYKVSGFTDRFAGTGGEASGTYNAGTDGGATGTGRAQGVLQTRLHFGKLPELIGIKPFNVNLQLQQGESIPLVDGGHYGTAVGLSAVYNLKSDLALGLAYNYAQIKDLDDPAIRAAGLDGDAEAMIVGLRRFGEKWYLGTVVSRLLNLEAADNAKYFDGWGWEVYGQYQLREKVWLTGGLNYLRPDSNQPSGDYEVKYGVVGLRYSHDGFQNMLYANVQFNNGRLSDGEELGNVFTIGVRWNLGEITERVVDRYQLFRARQSR